MLNSTKRHVYKNAKTHNVYHHCLCGQSVHPFSDLNGAKNPTRWGGTNLYSLYKGGPPPPRVYSDPQSHRILYWIKNEESMKLFAGTDTEGSRDGLASPAEFCKPAGLCVKFDHLFYSETSIKRNLPKCPLHRGL